MRTFGVICDGTGFVVYLGPATDPKDACQRATRDTKAWGNVGAFHRSGFGQPREESFSWLELSVYDVGSLPPNPNVDFDDEEALAAMTEDSFIDQYVARQY
ncbi:hypothetical protein B0E52_05575 [Rhodanobacter sp. C06]|uniref:hypothetical protein n=1 Tax=Rhodanobacter sp. C06 TaxID=1945854 RepID=UPI0009CAD8AC|nr:hypothetical protein [Rhodanobacter sp. C06]OOG45202.1 hypothetical protein B0E52_05575 [Rhodanobacter sp. C06]